MRSLSVTIPPRMQVLERDPRGYPIPFIVLRDKKKQPMFTINDVYKTTECRTKKLCSICGRRLGDYMWFVGGSRCFIHKYGAFIDPAVHYECGQYALQVCPFLAALSYSKRIEDKKLKPENRPDNMVLVEIEHMEPNLPEQFGIGACKVAVFVDNVYKVDRWDYVEWWHHGVPVNAPSADDVRRLTSEQPYRTTSGSYTDHTP